MVLHHQQDANGPRHLAEGVDIDSQGRLLGHIDKVQPSISGSDSAIGVTFNKIRMKDGREIAVKATILWIGEPPNSLNPYFVEEIGRAHF